MRAQLNESRGGAEAARRDADLALGLAENQASSLRALARAATVSAEAERRQWRVMERQASLMGVQLNDARNAAASSSKIVADQLRATESQAESMKSLATATEVTAQAAKLSATHAHRSVDVLRDTLHVQERAWIRFADLRETPFHIPWLLPYRLTFQFDSDDGNSRPANVLTLSCKSRLTCRPREAARRLPRPERSGTSEMQPA
jgi:hypothetical protein